MHRRTSEDYKVGLQQADHTKRESSPSNLQFATCNLQPPVFPLATITLECFDLLTYHDTATSTSTYCSRLGFTWVCDSRRVCIYARRSSTCLGCRFLLLGLLSLSGWYLWFNHTVSSDGNGNNNPLVVLLRYPEPTPKPRFFCKNRRSPKPRFFRHN